MRSLGARLRARHLVCYCCSDLPHQVWAEYLGPYLSVYRGCGPCLLCDEFYRVVGVREVVREAAGVLLHVSSASRAPRTSGCARFSCLRAARWRGVVEIGVVLWFTVFWMSFVSFSLARAFPIGRLAALPIRVSVLMSRTWRRRLCRFTRAAELFAASLRVLARPNQGVRLLRS